MSEAKKKTLTSGMRLEVLLATYNSADYLAEMLESLLRQTFDDFHLVVSDDCSTDDTVAIIEAVAPRFRNPVRIVRREKPSGSASANFSAMLEDTQADYVFLADHDDIWLPEKIAVGLENLQTAEAELGQHVPVLFHSNLQVVDAAGGQVHPSYWAFKQIEPSAGAQLPTALVHATVTGCAMAMNRALVARAGKIPDNAMMHDWWLNLVAAGFGRVIWDATPLISYRVHGKNVSRPKKLSVFAAIGQLDRVGRLRLNWQRRCAQGQAFYDRYAQDLPQPAQAQIAAFMRAQARPPVLRQIALVRGGFLWPGVWRNVVQLPFA